MTNKFVAGNCVGLSRRGKGYLPVPERQYYFSSFHILSTKDIIRGYYLTPQGDPIDIDNWVHSQPVLHYRGRCQTLKGKSLQPVSHFKMVALHEEFGCYNTVSTYILIKGVKTRAEGVYYKGMFYFNGMNSVGYKAKVYIDGEGYLRGWNTSSLSEKQKKQCYNPAKEKEAGFEAFHNMVRSTLQSLVKKEESK